MKKNLRFLAIMVLVIFAAGLALEPVIPAHPVQAAAEQPMQPAVINPSEKEAAPVAPSTHPVIPVVTGIVCVLFGVIAVIPLLIDDPARPS